MVILSLVYDYLLTINSFKGNDWVSSTCSLRLLVYWMGPSSGRSRIILHASLAHETRSVSFQTVSGIGPSHPLGSGSPTARASLGLPASEVCSQHLEFRDAVTPLLPPPLGPFRASLVAKYRPKSGQGRTRPYAI